MEKCADLLEKLTKLENRLVDNNANLEGKLLELHECTAKLEEKFLENTANLKKELEDKIMEKLCELEIRIFTLEDRIQEVQGNFAALDIKTIDERQRGLLLEKSSEFGASVGSAGHLWMKPPQFDGTMPWNIYRRQFEAAANSNGWSSTEKATALWPYEKMLVLFFKEYHPKNKGLLVGHLEMRYGQLHLEHVYNTQLKNRFQR
ncbi:unnamed protein product [Acanthoscelides obtectus]|uniref:Uncharacterized protein n=1 Tax=Acanthoscelides obtectus TaxID=200917 RepID=A0A9P0P751_ACAOB|nr:unnamed protein product [Acanthoscelides obtectus]CAK1655983.1 hypothetical protein AOBTE_LOCUS19488 [Acanthoscelides obtectus]